MGKHQELGKRVLICKIKDKDTSQDYISSLIYTLKLLWDCSHLEFQTIWLFIWIFNFFKFFVRHTICTAVVLLYWQLYSMFQTLIDTGSLYSFISQSLFNLISPYRNLIKRLITTKISVRKISGSNYTLIKKKYNPH